MTNTSTDNSTEKFLDDDDSLIARIDLQGRFTEVNEALVAMSGYSREELIDADCSLLLHPDMPSQVVADMWKTLTANRPWQGTVRNRSRNGASWWSEALVVPIRENQETVGYLSVNAKPDGEAVRRAEETHRHLHTSSAPLRRPVALTDLLSVKAGVTMGIFFVALMMIIGGVLGISGLQHSNESIETIYRNQLRPALMIGRISFLMADNRSRVALGLQDVAKAKASGNRTTKHVDTRALLAGHAAAVERNKKEIEEIWSSFVRIPQYESEAAMAREYWQSRQAYAAEGLAKSISALEKGNLGDAESIFRERVNPLYDEAAERADRLLQKIRLNAEEELRQVVSRNNIIKDTALLGIIGGLLIVVVSGGFFLHGVVDPLDRTIGHLERIAGGDLRGNIEIDGGGETGRLSRALAIMQLRLRVILDEIRHTSATVHDGCATLNELTMAVVESYEEQHDRIHQVIATTEKELSALVSDREHMIDTLELAERVLAGRSDGRSDKHAGLLSELRKMAASAQLQTYVNEETARKLYQVAALVVDNRSGAQRVWTASEHIGKTAGELEAQAKYFG